MVAAPASGGPFLAELVEVRCDGLDQQVASGRVQGLILPTG